MKKRLLLVMMLIFALLAGCSGLGDTEPTPTPTQKPSVSKPETTPDAGGESDGITPEPPSTSDSRPTVSGTPSVVGPPPTESDRPMTETPQQTPEQNEPTVPAVPAMSAADTLRTAAPGGSVLAAAYVGYAEGSHAEIMSYLERSGVCEQYPFIRDIGEDRFIEASGSELYVILPVNEDAILKVYAYELVGDSLAAGEELYSSGSGLPVLLKGNVSDIIPSFLVTAEIGGEGVEYNPCLSLKNGALNSGSGVYDCTPYSVLGLAPWGDSELCGEWFAKKNDTVLRLMLEADGSARYQYGALRGDVAEVFEGRWDESGDVLTVTLFGGPVGADGSFDAAGAYSKSFSLRWELQGIALVCEPVGGDVLIPGTRGAWFTFRPFDAFRLSGTWRTDSGYTLKLAENGEAVYSAPDKEYTGTWRYAGGVLTLNVSGSGYLSGSYIEENISADSVTLAFSYGEPLTPHMSNTGSDTFYRIEE